MIISMLSNKVIENLMNLARNLYVGRGIVIGKNKTGKFLVQVYWIMGRSFNSRNRRFVKNASGKVWTEAADPAKVKDPSLIIYTAMDERKGGIYVATNGSQTDSIMKNWYPSLSDGRILFEETILGKTYEPDPPNFTPRISAAFLFDKKKEMNSYCAEMSITKKWPWSDKPQQMFFPFTKFIPGVGFCITTYDGPGDPLPSFSGIPYPLPLMGNIEDTANVLWNALNPENRISLAAKFIEIATGKSETRIINAN